MVRDDRARAAAAILLLGLIGAEALRSADRPRGEAPRDPVRRRLELDTAPVAALALLPGLGPRRAREVDRLRSRRPIRRLEELEDVRGIGPTTRAGLAPFVTVGGVVPREGTR